MKTLEELLDKNSAWLILRDWFASAKNHYEILPSYAEDASAALVGWYATFTAFAVRRNSI